MHGFVFVRVNFCKKTKAERTALPFVLDGSSRIRLRSRPAMLQFPSAMLAVHCIRTPWFGTAFGLMGHLLRAIIFFVFVFLSTV